MGTAQTESARPGPASPLAPSGGGRAPGLLSRKGRSRGRGPGVRAHCSGGSPPGVVAAAVPQEPSVEREGREVGWPPLPQEGESLGSPVQGGQGAVIVVGEKVRGVPTAPSSGAVCGPSCGTGGHPAFLQGARVGWGRPAPCVALVSTGPEAELRGGTVGTQWRALGARAPESGPLGPLGCDQHPAAEAGVVGGAVPRLGLAWSPHPPKRAPRPRGSGRWS